MATHMTLNHKDEGSNPSPPAKFCKRCNTEKTIAEFNNHCWCKNCVSENDRLRYKKYYKKIRKNNVDNLRKIRIQLEKYLTDHACVDCGNSDIRVLEFDHIRGTKKFSIARASRNQLETNLE